MVQAGKTQPARRISSDTGASSQANADGVVGNSRERPRRRNRVIHSCLECRRRKLKCDRAEPCVNCRTSSQQCIYVTSANKDAQFRLKLVQMKEAKDALNDALVGGVDDHHLQPGSHRQARKRSRPRTEVVEDESDDAGDDGYLEPTPLAIQDAMYDNGVDDDINDLGFRLGRMRLGERIGGLYRPWIADEVASSLQHGPSGKSPLVSPPASSASPDEFLKPGLSFTAPSLNLIFNPISLPGSMLQVIPPRNVADKLLERYWDAVHPVARILHRPTFAQQYETLWELADEGHELPPTLAAIVCAILFSAVISMSEAQVQEGCYTSREELKTRLQIGVELALSKAQLLNSTKIETLQAFVAYLLPMCLDEISRAHSVMAGLAIRLAECMGLHRDPMEYGFSPAECQVRRLIWYQICYLDLKTSEIQGPRPFIHQDGYTTRLPLDVSLPRSSRSNIPLLWNDVVFSMVRFECQEMHRHCLMLRNRLDQKRISLTKALSKIDAFRITMDAKYGPLLNTSTPGPIQRLTSLVMKMIINLLFLIFLHRYMNSVTYRMPDRLRQIVLIKGTDALEAAVELESAEDLKQWSWYSTSYQQYHTAFLLLFEVFTYPMRKQANRIWRCLDFIFAEPLASIPPLSPDSATPTPQEIIAHRDVKARFLLGQISERMRVYQKGKGLKSPSEFKETMIVITPQKVGDDSDPRMLLNYAHDEPEQEPRLKHTNIESGMANLPPLKLDSGHAVVSQLTHALENPIGAWASSSGETPPWLQSAEAEPGSHASTMFYPDHLHDPATGISVAPTDAFATAPYLELQTVTGDIDPQLLEIDWDLWDTVFPPRLNDGDLDISDGF